MTTPPVDDAAAQRAANLLGLQQALTSGAPKERALAILKKLQQEETANPGFIDAGVQWLKDHAAKHEDQPYVASTWGADFEWEDPNGCKWHGPINTGVNPAQIDAGTKTMIWRKGADWDGSLTLEEAIQTTDPDHPHLAFAAAFQVHGKKGYPPTSAEIDLRNHLVGLTKPLEAFLEIAPTVAEDAKVVLECLELASAVAIAMAFIPVVGTTIAGIGTVVGAADEAKVRPMLSKLTEIIKNTQALDDDYWHLEEGIANYSISVDEAYERLTKYATRSKIGLWDLLKAALVAV